MIKYSIGQVEHLIVVLAFSTLLISIVRYEDTILKIVSSIDNAIGWGPIIDTSKIPSKTINICYRKLITLIIADYRNSKCKKMVNKVINTVKYFLL